jgi:hypothetical protein
LPRHRDAQFRFAVFDQFAAEVDGDGVELAGEALGATPGVPLNVTTEIEATTTGGFDDAKVRTVSEHAATLKFEQSGVRGELTRGPT